MSTYKKTLIFTNLNYGILPIELIENINRKALSGVDISLNNIMNLTNDEINQEIKNNRLKISVDADRVSKIKHLGIYYSDLMSNEDRIVVLSDYFEDYMNMSKSELEKRVTTLNGQYIDKYNDIKFLITRKLFDFDTSKKSYSNKLKQNMIYISMLYPLEYLLGISYLLNYSADNRTLLLSQMITRGIPTSPVKGFKQWNSLGVRIKKGQQGLMIYIPQIFNRKKTQDDDDQYITFKPMKVFAQSQTSASDEEPYLPYNKTSWNSKYFINDINRPSEQIRTLLHENSMASLDYMIRYMIDQMELENVDEYWSIYWLIRSVLVYVIGFTDKIPSYSSGYLEYVKPDNMSSISYIINMIINIGYNIYS